MNSNEIFAALETTLFLFLEIPESSLSGLVYPKSNFVATEILTKLLDSRLEALGQLVAPTHGCGPLNRSLFLCQIKDRHQAAIILRDVLVETKLEIEARLYRFDSAEFIYRCLFPTSGKDLLPEDFKHLTSDLAAPINSVQESFQKFTQGISELKAASQKRKADQGN